jgi:hypothetical protein
MQNLCFGPECTISEYRSCEASILLHWTQNDVSECFRAFQLAWTHKKMQNFCFGLECTFSGYRSFEASVLLHWTQNDVWVCFRALRLPWTHKKMQNLCFGPECTISEYWSCETSILLHWTQNDIWMCSEHFANLPHVRRCKTCASGPNALFRSTEVVKHPFYSIGPKMMFGSVSEHFN